MFAVRGQFGKWGGGEGLFLVGPNAPLPIVQEGRKLLFAGHCAQSPPPPGTLRLRGDRARMLTPISCLALCSQGPQVLGPHSGEEPKGPEKVPGWGHRDARKEGRG